MKKYTNDRFTMSLQQAEMHGIDYRSFERKDCLPDVTPLIAIAGIWGRYQNIMCLFHDNEGNRYLRNIYRRRDGYQIPELGLDAKGIEAGQEVAVVASISSKKGTD
jgi:hypothetical protein